MIHNPSRLAILSALLVFSPSPAWPQSTGRVAPPLVISSMSGRDLFEFYCASCHGRDGKGGGPAAAALTAPPSDLTTLAKRNGGRFPAARVGAVVTGDEDPPVPAHGSREMPVWGPIFRALDPNDQKNALRIGNIVAYIKSIQRRARRPAGRESAANYRDLDPGMTTGSRRVDAGYSSCW